MLAVEAPVWLLALGPVGIIVAALVPAVLVYRVSRRTARVEERAHEFDQLQGIIDTLERRLTDTERRLTRAEKRNEVCRHNEVLLAGVVRAELGDHAMPPLREYPADV